MHGHRAGGGIYNRGSDESGFASDSLISEISVNLMGLSNDAHERRLSKSCYCVALATRGCRHSGRQHSACGTVIAAGHASDVGLGVYNYDKDGYSFFATEPPNTGDRALSNFTAANSTVSVPAYISGVSPSGLSNLAFGFGYSKIKPTVASSQIQSGIAFLGGVTNGNEYPLLNITFGSGPLPPEVQIGVLVNSEPSERSIARRLAPAGAEWSHRFGVPGRERRLCDSGGRSRGQRPLFLRRVPTPGSVYQLFGTAGPNQQFADLAIAGLTFATVPEPSSLVGLAGLAAMGLFVVVRRRRHWFRGGQSPDRETAMDMRFGAHTYRPGGAGQRSRPVPAWVHLG